MIPGSPTTSGSARQYLRQNVTRLKLVSGTTLAIATPSICARDSPSSASRWSSQTTYSSAVRLPSVAVRQLPFSAAPSHIANEVFVLFELIASSIGPLLSAPPWSNLGQTWVKRKPERPRRPRSGGFPPSCRSPGSRLHQDRETGRAALRAP